MIGADGEKVVFVKSYSVGDIDRESREPTSVLTDLLPVDPNRRIGACAFEKQEDAATAFARVHFEGAAIPRGAMKIPVAQLTVALIIVPIVRHIDNAPATVVENGLFEADVFLGIGLVEGGAPSFDQSE